MSVIVKSITVKKRLKLRKLQLFKLQLLVSFTPVVALLRKILPVTLDNNLPHISVFSLPNISMTRSNVRLN